MPKVEIYGASDDLIEIDGDIKEEFYALEADNALLAFSDGTLLRIGYNDDGMWRISPIRVGSAIYEMVQATDPDSDYSDHAWLTGDIEWVVFGASYALAK